MSQSLQAKAQAIADTYAPTNQAQALTYQTAKRFGRPTSLTEDILTAIADLAAEGHYLETCCAAVGVPERTYYHWLERGKRDTEQGRTTLESEFWQSVKGQAAAWGEIELIREAKSGKMGWQGPMTVASRRHREHWQDKTDGESGPRVQVIVGGDASKVQINVVSPPTFAPDSLLEDSGKLLTDKACAFPSSLITAPMLTNADACQVQADSDPNRQLPAGEHPGGPYPVGAAVSAPRISRPQSRSGILGKKKDARSQKAAGNGPG
jgi:hypothetical protein